MKLRTCILFAAMAVISQTGAAQTETSVRRAAEGKNVNQDEIVSFNSDVPFDKAVSALGDLSKKLDGRLIINRAPGMRGKQIGVNIQSMYWKDAFELILRSNQLWYNDYPEYMEIVSFDEIGKQQDNTGVPGSKNMSMLPVGASASGKPMEVDSSDYYAKLREVVISAVFFDLNRTKLNESGVSFSIFRGHDLNLQVQFEGESKMVNNIFGVSVLPTGKSIPVDINAALSIFESDQIGEVISRPQILARSGQPASTQIGTNFSVLQKDFSGNTIQTFFPTGTILTVRPKVYKVRDIEFVDISYSVERSNVEIGTTSTFINKSTASGTVTLLNGEEVNIGGLYSNEETTVRQGVPLLKDLPWWVFGLRYIFGYDSKTINKRELIVLLKADLVPLLEDRVSQMPTKNVLQETRKENTKELDRQAGRKLE